MLAEHDADEPVPAKVQVAVGVNVTVPVGALAVPAAVSATVAVQLVGALAGTDEGVQRTVVVVDRVMTVTIVLPELVPCVESPP